LAPFAVAARDFFALRLALFEKFSGNILVGLYCFFYGGKIMGTTTWGSITYPSLALDSLEFLLGGLF
jgi:hypothetical protein